MDRGSETDGRTDGRTERDRWRERERLREVHVIIIQVKWFGQVIHDMKIGPSMVYNTPRA